MTTKPKLTTQKVMDRIFETLQAELGGRKDFSDQEMEAIRCGIGATLTGLHRLLLTSAKTPEDQLDQASRCFDTIHRLIESLQGQIQELKIEGVEIYMGRDAMPDGETGGKVTEH